MFEVVKQYASALQRVKAKVQYRFLIGKETTKLQENAKLFLYLKIP